MKTKKISKILALSVLSLISIFASAKEEKVLQIFKNGEVIQQYSLSEIDYIEVNDITGTIVNGHDYVDLGLPSGIKWATCNIGASTPAEYGDYFAWGETKPKSEYTIENCVSRDVDISDISGNPQYDAARANWGGTWRTPTSAELEELINECSWKWTSVEGITGYRVTGPNGKSIFLPAAGYRIDSSLLNADTRGRYWSSSLNSSGGAMMLDFDEINLFVGWTTRHSGDSVRPVTD